MRDGRHGRGHGRCTQRKRAAPAQSSLALAAAMADGGRRVRGGRSPWMVLSRVGREAAHRWRLGEGRGTGGRGRVLRTRMSAVVTLTRVVWATACVAARGRRGHTTESGRSSCRLEPQRLATDRQRRGGSFLRLPPRPPPSRRRGAVLVDAPAVCGEAARAADRGMAGVQRSTTAVSPLPTGRDAARCGWGLCCAAAAAAAAAAPGSPRCRRAHADASRHFGGVGASPNDRLSTKALVSVRGVGRGGAGGCLAVAPPRRRSEARTALSGWRKDAWRLDGRWRRTRLRHTAEAAVVAVRGCSGSGGMRRWWCRFRFPLVRCEGA